MLNHKLPVGKALTAAAALIKIRLLKRRVPLLASWNLTFRCNQRCKYCAAWKLDGPELDTPQVLAMIDQMHGLGMRWVTYSGGEPLLRKDIGQIVRHSKEKGISVFISTNGALVAEKIGQIRCIDRMNLSLDGREEVHDAVRGAGAFRNVIAAIETCREHGVPVSLLCVLSKHNLDAVDDVIEIANRYRVKAMFQPATKWLDSSTEVNPLAPEVEEYRRAIRTVVDRKKAGAPVSNSLSGLAHLAKWPEPAKIWCSAGLLTCSIGPDGFVVACHQAQTSLLASGIRERDEAEGGFRTLRPLRNCSQCWCAPLVELQLVFSLNPEAALNALRMLV